MRGAPLYLLAFGLLAMVSAGTILDKCKNIDRELALLSEKEKSYPVTQKVIMLQEGEPLLVTEHPVGNTTKFDISLRGAKHLQTTGGPLRTVLTYKHQKFDLAETELIPAGYNNDFVSRKRSLQMAEMAEVAPNLVSVACKITDPQLKFATLRAIQQKYPHVDCSCHLYSTHLHQWRCRRLYLMLLLNKIHLRLQLPRQLFNAP